MRGRGGRRSTPATWSCASMRPPSPRSGSSRPGCAWPAATGSRTRGAWAPPRRPSSAGSCSPGRWCGGAIAARRRRRARAGEPTRGPPRQRRARPARRLRGEPARRRRGRGPTVRRWSTGWSGGRVRARRGRAHRGRAGPAARRGAARRRRRRRGAGGAARGRPRRRSRACCCAAPRTACTSGTGAGDAGITGARRGAPRRPPAGVRLRRRARPCSCSTARGVPRRGRSPGSRRAGVRTRWPPPCTVRGWLTRTRAPVLRCARVRRADSARAGSGARTRPDALPVGPCTLSPARPGGEQRLGAISTSGVQPWPDVPEGEGPR